LTLGPVGVACASEISTLPLRATVQGILFITQVSSSWVVGFIVPYIINPDAANLGAKIAYIFFGMGVIFSIHLYLYIPETKGLSFEDVTPSEIVLILAGLFVLHKHQPQKVPASHQELSC
jgi:hypothetical protein